jgi:hypothetical protein
MNVILDFEGGFFALEGCPHLVFRDAYAVSLPDHSLEEGYSFVGQFLSDRAYIALSGNLEVCFETSRFLAWLIVPMSCDSHSV